MATVYNEISDFQKGKEIAKSATRINKKYAPAHFELGYAEMSLCNKVAAKDAFNKVLVLDKLNANSHYYLGIPPSRVLSQTQLFNDSLRHAAFLI